MAQSCSISVKKTYGIQRVCGSWQIARSTVYHNLKKIALGIHLKKRGPKPMVDDARLLELLREIIDERSKVGIHGEGSESCARSCEPVRQPGNQFAYRRLVCYR
jgi:hypothetical protein